MRYKVGVHVYVVWMLLRRQKAVETMIYTNAAVKIRGAAVFPVKPIVMLWTVL